MDAFSEKLNPVRNRKFLNGVNWHYPALPRWTKKALDFLARKKWLKKSKWYLAGGTAIALQLGHRRSIDFDLFTGKKFDNLKIRRQIAKLAKIEKNIINDLGEYTVLVQGVKITFLSYPFKIKYNNSSNPLLKRVI